MKVKMTVVYGEKFCTDLKEALSCTSDLEFLGAFQYMMKQALVDANVDADDIKIDIQLD